jgi:hypothetical protein
MTMSELTDRELVAGKTISFDLLYAFVIVRLGHRDLICRPTDWVLGFD